MEKNSGKLRVSVKRWSLSSVDFLYAVTGAATFALYVCVVMSVAAFVPEMLGFLDDAFRIFACVFLLIRFNPYRSTNIEYSQTEKLGVFITALLLILSQGLIVTARYMVTKMKHMYSTLQ